MELKSENINTKKEPTPARLPLAPGSLGLCIESALC